MSQFIFDEDEKIIYMTCEYFSAITRFTIHKKLNSSKSTAKAPAVSQDIRKSL